MKNFFKEKLISPLLAQLKQGASPEGLALTCALGASLAIIPVLGSTTLLCLGVGFFLKLNQPALQVVNYLLYPVQLILLPVFLSLGARLTSSEPILFNLKLFSAEFQASPLHFLQKYGMVGLHAVLVWALIAPLLSFILYYLFKLLFSKMRPA